MKLTPMLEQYFEIKRQVPDAILFYRLGDFYEMFFEDAQRAAPLLDLVLTARGRGGESEAPMCGVPYHAAEQHIAKLVRNGFSVAICEQVEDPAEAKGIVRRDIVRIVTPGTAIEGHLLDRQASYLLAWMPSDDRCGAAYLDVSTGDLVATTYDGPEDPRLRDDFARYAPREAVIPSDGAAASAQQAFSALGIVVNPIEASFFGVESAGDYLTRHFSTQSLRGFGLEERDPRTAAAGAALRYAATSHKRELTHVTAIRVETDAAWMSVDSATLQNLEVFESRDGRAAATLWHVIDATKTAMGARTLRAWLCRPLRDRAAIFDRHDAVDELTRNRTALDALATILGTMADLERLASRVTLRTASPRDCLALAGTLAAADALRPAGESLAGPLLREILARCDGVPAAVNAVRETLEDVPSLSAREGGVIRRGVHSELDDLRSIARDSKSVLLRIEADERQRTGIPSLKVRYNSVFGYYIEISKANLAKVPAEYIRKQTLVNAERYITPELKVLEEKIVGAEQKSIAIEIELYEQLLGRIAADAGAILASARAIGEADALASLATVAIRNRYVRPQLTDEPQIMVEDGRHPVIETLTAERFIPNATSIHRDRNGIQIITGPNMGGKSTYLRQVALIVLLNQAGSFVPAARAELGIFDRIFTRVGASDNLARGESTFMVEMHETANILNNTTRDSLIVLDEVGRGTATFDGLSLAWAIIEYLHDTPSRSAITLFATHYHEVTDLAKTKPRVSNCNVAVKEWNDQIIFLRKVVEGAADKSYGIHVAKLAGIPPSVIRRSEEILRTLEKKEREVVDETQRPEPPQPGGTRQLSLFESKEEILRELRGLPLDTMTPLEALTKLHELQKRLFES
ncbi:MAG: DNA mismatch repair protein MutS [Thermoanaerobaculia bacterium]